MTVMGERIKKLRLDRHISRQLLADDIGSSVAAIKAYENGYREPNARAMAALEQYFGVSGAYLRGETDDPEPQYYWEDAEFMADVESELGNLMQRLYSAIRKATPKTQKMVDSMFIDLFHVLARADEEQEVSIELLENCYRACTRFADACEATNPEEGPERLNRIRTQKIADLAKELKQAQAAFRKAKAAKLSHE